jgi:hypothetical protein
MSQCSGPFGDVEEVTLRKRPAYAEGMTLEQIRIYLWFEFYKMALADPRYRHDLTKSRNHYRDWGRVRPTDPFAPWWKKNSILFGDSIFEDRRQPFREWLCVTVPLNQTETHAVAAFRELFRRRQRELAQDQESPRRTKAGRATGIPLGLYDLTPGTEFRVGPSIDALTIYRRFVAGRSETPRVNRELLDRVKKHYAKNGWELPSPLRGDPADPSTLRSLRRYIHRGLALVRAAAVGDFPGKSIVKSRG